MLPLSLPEPGIRELFSRARTSEGYTLTIDLQQQTVSDDHGLALNFPIDPFRKECLLKGLDDIGLTLLHEEKIHAYEASHGNV